MGLDRTGWLTGLWGSAAAPLLPLPLLLPLGGTACGRPLGSQPQAAQAAVCYLALHSAHAHICPSPHLTSRSPHPCDLAAFPCPCAPCPAGHGDHRPPTSPWPLVTPAPHPALVLCRVPCLHTLCPAGRGSHRPCAGGGHLCRRVPGAAAPRHRRHRQRGYAQLLARGRRRAAHWRCWGWRRWAAPACSTGSGLASCASLDSLSMIWSLGAWGWGWGRVHPAPFPRAVSYVTTSGDLTHACVRGLVQVVHALGCLGLGIKLLMLVSEGVPARCYSSSCRGRRTSRSRRSAAARPPLPSAAGGGGGEE